jgi:PUB domain/Thioredoxin-like
VFVSGDRNPSEFEEYFSTMPWLAVAGFQNQLLSAMYQVQGIPSLVILDTVSGQVVVPNSMARKDVHQACQRGEDSICDMFRRWLREVPAETADLLALLEASCEPIVAEEVLIPEPYLISDEYQLQRSARESLISELMDDGLDTREATEAAISVERLSTDDATMKDTYAHGLLNGGFTVRVQSPDSEKFVTNKVFVLANKIRQCYDSALISRSLETIRKYLGNCIKTPHAIHFRKIDISFKVVDANIGRVEGGLDVLEALGFQIEIYGNGYIVYIPVQADLAILDSDIGLLIEELRTK